MSQNKFKLNADMTGSGYGYPTNGGKDFPSITINGVIVPVLNELVGNLGAFFDPIIHVTTLETLGNYEKILNTGTGKSRHW